MKLYVAYMCIICVFSRYRWLNYRQL